MPGSFPAKHFWAAGEAAAAGAYWQIHDCGWQGLEAYLKSKVSTMKLSHSSFTL